MHKFTQQQVEKRITILNHTCILCLKNMKVTYRLSTSTHSSKWRREQTFILNHTSCFRMLCKYESNLLAVLIHKFTQQQVEKTKKLHTKHFTLQHEQ